jgi:hypothetical protein
MSFDYSCTEDSPPPPAGTGLCNPAPHLTDMEFSDAFSNLDKNNWTDLYWQGFPIHDGGAFLASDTVPAKRTYDDEDVDYGCLANKRHQTLRMPLESPSDGYMLTRLSS